MASHPKKSTPPKSVSCLPNRRDSVGCLPCIVAALALPNTSARDLEIYPNLWAGVGLIRVGAGTALVGSYSEVADRIIEYSNLGLSHFIFSGYPDLEEVFHSGEGVVPHLLARGINVKNHARSDVNDITWFAFTSGPPQIEALNAGQIDFPVTGNMPPILGGVNQNQGGLYLFQ